MPPSKPRGFPISLWKLASSDLERCSMLEFWSRIASEDRVEILLAHAQARFDLNPLPMPPPSMAVPTSVWLTYLKAARKQMMDSWHKMESRERVLDQLALAVTLTPPASSLQEAMNDRPLVHLLGSDLYIANLPPRPLTAEQIGGVFEDISPITASVLLPLLPSQNVLPVRKRRPVPSLPPGTLYVFVSFPSPLHAVAGLVACTTVNWSQLVGQADSDVLNPPSTLSALVPTKHNDSPTAHSSPDPPKDTVGPDDSGYMQTDSAEVRSLPEKPCQVPFGPPRSNQSAHKQDPVRGDAALNLVIAAKRKIEDRLNSAATMSALDDTDVASQPTCKKARPTATGQSPRELD